MLRLDVETQNGFRHSHFIKTVEDLYEALVQPGVAIKFGLAFCEASGDRKVWSWTGQKPETGAALQTT